MEFFSRCAKGEGARLALARLCGKQTVPRSRHVKRGSVAGTVSLSGGGGGEPCERTGVAAGKGEESAAALSNGGDMNCCNTPTEFGPI